MPAFKNHNGAYGVPNVPQTMAVVSNLHEETLTFPERNYTISGVSRDNTGVALANCTVYLMNWTTKVVEQTTTSDGSGNYSFVVDKTAAYRVVMDNASGPVAGVSRNDLAGS
jgi:hypothetical protein